MSTSSTQIPPSIFTTPHRSKLNAAYNQSKNYKLFIAPESPSELGEFCFKGIGDSASFCINKDCKINHNGERWLVAPGDAFIKSTNKAAFIEPSVSSVFWEEDLKSAWLQDSTTLSEWVHRFGLVKSKLESNNHEQISGAAIKVENDIVSGALSFQSTRKRKVMTKKNPITLSYDLGENISDLETKPLSMENVGSCFVNIDKGMHSVVQNLNALYNQAWSQEAENRMAFIQGEERMKLIESSVGMKPEVFLPGLEAPTVWGSLGLLGSKLVTLGGNVENHINKRTKRETEKWVGSLRTEMSDLNQKLNLQRETIIALGNGLQIIQQEINNIRSLPTPATSNQSRFDHHTSTRLQQIEDDILELKKANEKDSVKFANLGLKTYTEAVNWISLNCGENSPYSGFGFFSDVHVVMEIINIEMGNSVATNPNIDSIKNRADLIKLNLKNEWERYTITSFDRTIPKLLLSNAKFQIVRDTCSYFDMVPSWEHWKATEMGFRTRIVAALKNHKRTMEEYLRNTLDSNSHLFSVAYQSLLASISWIEEMIRYIDSTYEEYVEAKFGPQKAWNITTRLVKALLYYIAQPRMGVSQALHNTDYEQMKSVTFYGIVRSLDRMYEISKEGFRNCDVVSSELVKVLSKNTGFELIDALDKRVGSLETSDKQHNTSIKDLQSKQKETGSLASTLNNKVTGHGTRLEKLEKARQKKPDP